MLTPGGKPIALEQIEVFPLTPEQFLKALERARPNIRSLEQQRAQVVDQLLATRDDVRGGTRAAERSFVREATAELMDLLNHNARDHGSTEAYWRVWDHVADHVARCRPNAHGGFNTELTHGFYIVCARATCMAAGQKRVFLWAQPIEIPPASHRAIQLDNLNLADGRGLEHLALSLSDKRCQSDSGRQALLTHDGFLHDP